jgi:hypothetical protein
MLLPPLYRAASAALANAQCGRGTEKLRSLVQEDWKPLKTYDKLRLNALEKKRSGRAGPKTIFNLKFTSRVGCALLWVVFVSPMSAIFWAVGEIPQSLADN